MAKLYDLVETSKMSMEYDGSLIDSVHSAKTALEVGRLVAIDADGTVRYAVAGDAKVYLHTSVEKIAETFRGRTDFRVEAGKKLRMVGMRAGDVFKTTAVDGVAVKGDKVILGANGILAKGTPAGTENFIAEVLEVGTLGYDKARALKVKVIKA
jgi:hypothetical protein